jgi:hypothetical protein
LSHTFFAVSDSDRKTLILFTLIVGKKFFKHLLGGNFLVGNRDNFILHMSALIFWLMNKHIQFKFTASLSIRLMV